MQLMLGCSPPYTSSPEYRVEVTLGSRHDPSRGYPGPQLRKANGSGFLEYVEENPKPIEWTFFLHNVDFALITPPPPPSLINLSGQGLLNSIRLKTGRT